MKRLILIFVAMAVAATAVAQKRIGNGQVAGSFESSSIYYMNDKALSDAPEDRFGSNNYLKVDYSNGRFSAGLQANAFLPVLQGYDDFTDGYKFYLASKYIQWTDKNFEILVGDIFDQYGNGLIYRSFEDRQLGFNNSIEGVRGVYNFGRYVSLKGMYGRPRLYTDYAKSWVRGADLVVSLADICGIQENVVLSLEGSYVNRFQKLNLEKDYKMIFEDAGMDKTNLNMYSGRLNFGWNGLTLRGEYVHKSKDLAPNASKAVGGSAILGEAGYSYGGFSVMATYRQLENMLTRSSLYDNGMANSINYLPALTRQYTYMLANLNPYQVNATGEMGGQADVCYSLRSKENRYRYWNFHVNFSTFYTLRASQTDDGSRRLLWRDINIDVERQWSKKLKTILLYSRQEKNMSITGFQNKPVAANIFVGDVTYKFNRKMSLRVELQYLYADRHEGKYDYEGDWVAGLVEFSLAPRWSFFVQDMYNIDKTKINYYSGGFSYTYNRTRVQLSYGRNRAGYVCSGGVCRYSPADTGVNLMLTSSF